MTHRLDDAFPAIFRQARPFYCAHQCAVQLAGATMAECGWDPLTLLPDMAQLRREVERGVKMVVITTPGRRKTRAHNVVNTIEGCSRATSTAAYTKQHKLVSYLWP